MSHKTRRAAANALGLEPMDLRFHQAISSENNLSGTIGLGIPSGTSPEAGRWTISIGGYRRQTSHTAGINSMLIAGNTATLFTQANADSALTTIRAGRIGDSINDTYSSSMVVAGETARHGGGQYTLRGVGGTFPTVSLFTNVGTTGSVTLTGIPDGSCAIGMYISVGGSSTATTPGVFWSGLTEDDMVPTVDGGNQYPFGWASSTLVNNNDVITAYQTSNGVDNSGINDRLAVYVFHRPS